MPERFLPPGKRPIAAPILAAGRSRIAVAVARIIGGLALATFLLALWNPDNDDGVTVAFYTPILLGAAAAEGAARRGHVRTVGWAVTAGLLLISTAAVWLAGGLSGNVAGSFTMALMVAMVLLGRHASIAVAAVSVATITLLIVSEAAGRLPEPRFPSNNLLNQWLSLVVPMALSTYLVVSLVALLERALAEAERHAHARDRAQAELVHAQKLDTVGRLVASVAHDFNNLLTVVMNASDVLEGSAEGDDERRAAHELQLAARRAALLTQRLLAFSRPSEGQPRPVDLAARTREAAPVFERLVGAGVTLVWDIEDDARVLIDPLAYDQVLLNLLINAREAMEGRGHVGVTLRTRGQRVTLVVDDSGPGIPLALREQVLQPFFTTKPTGTGLGLSTVTHLLEPAGATLTISDAPGHGARFHIAFDRIVEAPDDSTTLGLPVSLPEARRALVVDDFAPVCEATALMLRSAGWEVHVAADGLEAVAVLERQEVDLLVSDVEMPGMSGVELARHARASRPDLPVLLVSGQPLDVVPEGVGFLLKPYRQHALFRAIAERLLP